MASATSRLGRSRQFVGAAAAAEQDDAVGVAAEAAPLAGDVVGDDQVEVFFSELLGGVGEQVFALGREADADEVAGRLGQDVGVGDEFDRQAGGLPRRAS